MNYDSDFFHSSYINTSNYFAALADLSEESINSLGLVAEFKPDLPSSPTEPPNSTGIGKSTSEKKTLNLSLNLPPKKKNWRSLVVNVDHMTSKFASLQIAVDYIKPDVIIGWWCLFVIQG